MQKACLFCNKNLTITITNHTLSTDGYFNIGNYQGHIQIEVFRLF